MSAPDKVILLTGASSGFGALTARALARRGHTVYAGMRAIGSRNAAARRALLKDTAELSGRAEAIELDVCSQSSVDAAVGHVLAEHRQIDVVIHNAGHMVLGAAEAFTVHELAEVYDVNVLGTQRVNRAVLPHLRAAGAGLLVWVGSSSTRGGCPPFLAPYFAAKAAMDALAVSYAAELIRFGIDTTIVVPGAFTKGTNHFVHAGAPADTARAAAYTHLYGQLMQDVNTRLAELEPTTADPMDVAQAIVDAVEAPAFTGPLRVHVDPSRDGSEVVSAVADRIRVDFYRRLGLQELLTPRSAL